LQSFQKGDNFGFDTLQELNPGYPYDYVGPIRKVKSMQNCGETFCMTNSMVCVDVRRKERQCPSATERVSAAENVSATENVSAPFTKSGISGKNGTSALSVAMLESCNKQLDESKTMVIAIGSALGGALFVCLIALIASCRRLRGGLKASKTSDTVSFSANPAFEEPRKDSSGYLHIAK